MNANSWLIDAVLFFLAISLYLYCILGGADFGAGILELFLGKSRKEEQRQLITHAMGPVWEANHVWLILAIVILLMGFPTAFAQICIYFHIPLTILLIGIIFRGCSFTFRHYDAIKDRSQLYYTGIFAISSFLAPFMLGIIAGGIILGQIPSLSTDYAHVYILPWVNGFSLSLGLFVCSLFTYLAAVYLTGETKDPELQAIFRKRARAAGFLSVGAGIFVFGTAWAKHFLLLQHFLHSPLSLASMVLATVLFLPLWFSVNTAYPWLSRVLVSTQVALVLLGWFSIQFPVVVKTESMTIDIYQAAAPAATLRQLLYALLVGSALIFPSLGYLLKIFKSHPE